MITRNIAHQAVLAGHHVLFTTAAPAAGRSRQPGVPRSLISSWSRSAIWTTPSRWPQRSSWAPGEHPCNPRFSFRKATVRPRAASPYYVVFL